MEKIEAMTCIVEFVDLFRISRSKSAKKTHGRLF